MSELQVRAEWSHWTAGVEASWSMYIYLQWKKKSERTNEIMGVSVLLTTKLLCKKDSAIDKLREFTEDRWCQETIKTLSCIHMHMFFKNIYTIYLVE